MPRARLAVVVAAGALLAPGIAMAAPSPPTLTGSIANGGNLSGAVSTAISGHYAYIPGYYSGVVDAVDILNPANPVVAGSSAWSSSLVAASGINVSNGYAYVVSKNRNGPKGTGSNDDGTGNSLTIVDIATDPTHPAIVGVLRDAVRLFGAYGVAVKGNYAYVAAQGCLSGQPCPNPNVGDTFAVIDVSSPAAPRIVATLANSSLPAPWTGSGALKHATAVAIAGNYAYVTASYTDRLTILDISNPLAPKIVASLQDASQLNFDVDVVVANGYAYVADQARGSVASQSSTCTNPAIRRRRHSHEQHVAQRGVPHQGARQLRVRGSRLRRCGVGDRRFGPHGAALRRRVQEQRRFSTARPVSTSTRQGDMSSPFRRFSPPIRSRIYPPYPFDPGGPTLTGTAAVVAIDPVPITVAIASVVQAAQSDSADLGELHVLYERRGRIRSLPVGQRRLRSVHERNDADVHVVGARLAHIYRGRNGRGGERRDATPIRGRSSPRRPPPGRARTCSTISIAPTGLSAQTGRLSSAGFTSFLVSSNQAVDSSTSAYAWAIGSRNSSAQTRALSQPWLRRPADIIRVCARFTSPTVAARSGYCVEEAANSWTIRRIDSGTAVTLGIDCLAAGRGRRSHRHRRSGLDDRGVVRTCGRLVDTPDQPDRHDLWRGRLPRRRVARLATRQLRRRHVGNCAGCALEHGRADGDRRGPAGADADADPGTWTGNPAPTFTYQWQRCDTAGANCVDIASATAQTYQLVAADVGATVRVNVTGDQQRRQRAPPRARPPQPSPPRPVAPSNTAPPTVTGAAQQGQTLTADPGTWTGNPAPTFTYQWQRCDTAGANCVDIASATGADLSARRSRRRRNRTRQGHRNQQRRHQHRSKRRHRTVTGAAASGPRDPVLDNFNRANGPIGPNWGQIFGGFVDFAISGSEALDPSASSFAWDFWAALQFGPDSEAYATITTPGTDAIRICARMTNPTTSQRSGYCVQATGNTWSIRRIDNGTATQLGAVATQTVAAGSRFGITVVGTTITAWYAPSATAAWTRSSQLPTARIRARATSRSKRVVRISTTSGAAHTRRHAAPLPQPDNSVPSRTTSLPDENRTTASQGTEPADIRSFVPCLPALTPRPKCSRYARRPMRTAVTKSRSPRCSARRSWTCPSLRPDSVTTLRWRSSERRIRLPAAARRTAPPCHRRGRVAAPARSA